MPRIPETMRAATIDRFGPPSVLKIRQLPVPRVGRRDVLIRIDTAGVGIWDAEIRGGWWPGGGRPTFPVVLGTDGSGRVVGVGASVRRFRVGDRVHAYEFTGSRGGFYADYAAVPERAVGRIPRGMSLRDAGAMTVTGLTALQGVDALRLRRGETVVIHGASGGVGTLALQFARLRGARVIATATGRDGLALVRRLGADAAVDGRRRDLAEEIRRLAPGGVDAVLAFAGRNLPACLDALKERGGRLAYPNGVEPVPRKRRGVRTTSYDAKADARRFQALRRASEALRLRVPIGAAYRLADAAKAHRRVEGHVLGKVVLIVRSR